MPELGDITLASRLGLESPRHYMVWVECSECHKQYWTRLDHQKKAKNKSVCRHCSSKVTGRWRRRELSHNWKGGKKKTGDGYIEVLLDPADFFYPMGKANGYVREHRLVIAKHLKRCLLSWEVVHHKNGIKDDNRLENLQLVKAQGKHNTQLKLQLNKQAKLIEQLQRKITELDIEITILKGEANAFIKNKTG